jgi:hypothetical protein
MICMRREGPAPLLLRMSQECGFFFRQPKNPHGWKLADARVLLSAKAKGQEPNTKSK